MNKTCSSFYCLKTHTSGKQHVRAHDTGPHSMATFWSIVYYLIPIRLHSGILRPIRLQSFIILHGIMTCKPRRHSCYWFPLLFHAVPMKQLRKVFSKALNSLWQLTKESCAVYIELIPYYSFFH